MLSKVKVNGINMYYEVHGEGFPLVLIQGLSENIYWWDPPLIKELSKNFKIIDNNAHMIHTQEPEKFVKTLLNFFN